MNKEELLKEIMKLPKTKTDNPITTMNSINVDDLISAVDRLNKVPDYNDLLKENQKLKQKYENAVADYETTMFEKEQLNSLVNSCQEEIRELKKQLENKYSRTGTLTNEVLYEENTKLINQQKKFIEYLEYQVKLQEELNDIHLATGFEEILSKYKEIIGDKQ